MKSKTATIAVYALCVVGLLMLLAFAVAFVGAWFAVGAP